jgi:hypothetical protein
LGTGKEHTGFWWGLPEGKNHLELLCLEGIIIFKRIFKKLDGGMD